MATNALGKLRKIFLDGKTYELEVFQQIDSPKEVTRILIPTYIGNKSGCEVVRVCVESIQRFNQTGSEIWLIDNNSPREFADWLTRFDERVNVVLNRTEPIPPEQRSFHKRLTERVAFWRNRPNWGSYANAVALELGIRLIAPESQYVMTLHMDTIACHSNWLAFLHEQMKANVGAAGVRMDYNRQTEGVLHILGCLINFSLFRSLGLDFYPELPAFDVGDRVTVAIRDAGYEVYACANTIWKPELSAQIPSNSPLKTLPVDRAFDEEGNIIFLHLGRGVRKSTGDQTVKGLPVDEWVNFADRNILGNAA